jgi:hypothetical protein
VNLALHEQDLVIRGLTLAHGLTLEFEYTNVDRRDGDLQRFSIALATHHRKHRYPRVGRTRRGYAYNLADKNLPTRHCYFN